MFYSDNLLLSVLARSCKESAVLLQMHTIYLCFICCTWTALVLRMFSGTILLLLLTCNGVLLLLVLVFTFQFVVYVLSVSWLTVFSVFIYHILFLLPCAYQITIITKFFTLHYISHP